MSRDGSRSFGSIGAATAAERGTLAASVGMRGGEIGFESDAAVRTGTAFFAPPTISRTPSASQRSRQASTSCGGMPPISRSKRHGVRPSMRESR
jgi:hypothetical protein